MKSPLYKKWANVQARYLFFTEKQDLVDTTNDLELVWHLGQEYANTRNEIIYIFNKTNDEISGICYPKEKKDGKEA